MAGEEVCIIIIPNDFADEKGSNQNADDCSQQTKAQKATHINENKSSKNEEEDDQYEGECAINQLIDNELNQNSSGFNQRKPRARFTSVGRHTEEYPCPECEQSLASRFRYHIIPKLKLRDTVWIPTNNNKSFFIVCYTELGPQSDGIIDELRRAEIGIRDGTKVCIIPLSCALGIQKVVTKQNTLSTTTLEAVNSDEEATDEIGLSTPVDTPLSIIEQPSYGFMKSIRGRMTVHKITRLIRQQSSLTFDYLFFCVLASIIAGLGLLEDSTVILVASMLISPLMGPIMGFAVGMHIHDKSLWRSGLKTEFIGLAVSVLTGFILGLCTTWSETKWGSSKSFPTNEMRTRGDYRSLWVGALVALPSGAAAALSVLGGNVSSLVGVAISASLLPPTVNTGLLLGYSVLAASRSNIGRHSTRDIDRTAILDSLSNLVNCTTFVHNDYMPLYSCNMVGEASHLALCSFAVTMINILCICAMVVVVLIIKKVVPIIPDNEITRFWYSDMQRVRTASNNTNRRS